MASSLSLRLGAPAATSYHPWWEPGSDKWVFDGWDHMDLGRPVLMNIIKIMDGDWKRWAPVPDGRMRFVLAPEETLRLFGKLTWNEAKGLAAVLYIEHAVEMAPEGECMFFRTIGRRAVKD